MTIKKILSILYENNINDVQIIKSKDESLSFEMHNGKFENYTTNISSEVNIAANINNRLVTTSTDNMTEKNFKLLANNLIENSKLINNDGLTIFETDQPYKKCNNYNKNLNKIEVYKKKNLIQILQDKIKNMCPLITDIEIGYYESEYEMEFINSKSIHTKEKRNSYAISCAVVIKKDNQVKTYFLNYTNKNFEEFNMDEFAEKLVSEAIQKLDPIKLSSKKYDVVLSPEVVNRLLKHYLSQLNAELILKNTSWFVGKVNTQVANKKITITDMPLKKGPFFKSHDDQGVQCKNLTLIKNGVLKTYLHNLESAKKFHCESTGHGCIGAGKVYSSPHRCAAIKPGKLTKEKILCKLHNGIYITDLEGFHAGMNSLSGDFSLKAEGFEVKDGKICKPLEMMTMNGNLFNIFSNVQSISQNIEYSKVGHYAPCLYLKNIAISF